MTSPRTAHLQPVANAQDAARRPTCVRLFNRRSQAAEKIAGLIG